MTYLGYFVTLNSGDLGSNLPIDLSRSKSISLDPAWREEHNGVQIFPLSYVVQKLMIKTFFPKNTQFWPLMTSGARTIDRTANLKVQIDS